MSFDLTPEKMNAWNEGGLPHMLGIKVTECAPGRVVGRLPVTKPLIAGNGALWAPAIVALADTLCAYGVSTKWPDGANGFTTVELKTNFMGTLNSGAIRGEGRCCMAGAPRRCGTRRSRMRKAASCSPRSVAPRSFSIRKPSSRRSFCG